MTLSIACTLPVSPRVAGLMPWACGIARPDGSYEALKTGGKKSRRAGRKSRRAGRKSRRAGRKSRRGGVSLNYSSFSKSKGKSKKAGRKSRKGGRK